MILHYWTMKLAGRNRLRDFVRVHPDAESAIETWVALVKTANWGSGADIRRIFALASFIGNRRVVFNIKGNHFRLLAQVSYQSQVAVVLKIGTHAEYDKWKLS